MSISDFYTTAEKQWVKILTVDPRSRRIEGALKDRSPVQISLYEIPSGFRWPQEGEWWLIHRENREWFLRAPLQRSETGVKVEDLNPGDTLLGIEGAKVVVEGDLVTASGETFLPVKTPQWIDITYNTDWQTGFGFTVQVSKNTEGLVLLRGVAERINVAFDTSNSTSNIGTLPEEYKPTRTVFVQQRVAQGGNLGVYGININLNGIIDISDHIAGTVLGDPGTSIALDGITFATY